MSETGENVDRSENISPVKEIVVMGGLLLLYYAIIAGRQALDLHPDLNYLGSACLLLGSVIWLRKHRGQFSYTHFGTRSWLGMGTVIALVIAGLILALSPGATSAYAEPWHIRSLALVFFVPVVEEVFFRGLLLDHLIRSSGKILAVILVSALFGFLHYAQGTMLPMAVLSILLCVVTIQSKSILTAVSIHVAWNSLAVIFRTTDSLPKICQASAVAIALVAIHIALAHKKTGTPISEAPTTT